MAFNMVLPKPLDAISNRELMEKKAAGDPNARDELIEGNMRLVTHAAYGFKNTGIDFDDLVSVGSIGLMKAVDSFKLEKEIKFATYAARCITNEILMLLRKNKKHTLGTNLEANLAVDKDGNQLTVADITPDKSIAHFSEAVIYDDTLEEVRDLLAALPPLHQRVLNLRYMQNQTQREVSKALNISQSYVSRLEQSAAERVRKAHEMKELTFEQNLANQKQSKGDVVGMAGKGNREEAIRLLEKTTLSYRQISDKTGVPSGTIGTMAGAYRPKHVRDQIKQDIFLQQEQARKEKAMKAMGGESPAVQDVIRKFDTPKPTPPGFLDTTFNDVNRDKPINKQTDDFLDSKNHSTDLPGEKSIGNALEEYRLELEKQLRAEIEEEMVVDSNAEQTSKAKEPVKEEPKKSKINRKLSFSYSADATDITAEDFIEELETIILNVKENHHNKVTFSMSLTAD